jgi:hypothetical protein
VFLKKFAGANFADPTRRGVQNPYFTAPSWGKKFFLPSKNPYISGVFKDRKWLILEKKLI